MSADDIDAMRAEHDAAMDEWAKPLVAALPRRTPGRVVTDRDMRDQVSAYIRACGERPDDFNVVGIVDRIQAEYGTVDLEKVSPDTFDHVVMSGRWPIDGLESAWHGTRTCVNCGCDIAHSYKLKTPVRTLMGKRARKAARRDRRTVNATLRALVAGGAF